MSWLSEAMQRQGVQLNIGGALSAIGQTVETATSSVLNKVGLQPVVSFGTKIGNVVKNLFSRGVTNVDQTAAGLPSAGRAVFNNLGLMLPLVIVAGVIFFIWKRG